MSADKFEILLENIEVKAPRRVWAKAKNNVFDCIKELHTKYGFDHLCTITGLENNGNFEILYHLSQAGTGNLLTLRDIMPIEGAKTKSIVPIFQSAVWYEREINDLLGVEFEGLPPGNRYPLPDDWPAGDHPLRKNWQPKQEVK